MRNKKCTIIFIQDFAEGAIVEGKTKKINQILPSNPDMLIQVVEKGGS